MVEELIISDKISRFRLSKYMQQKVSSFFMEKQSCSY